MSLKFEWDSKKAVSNVKKHGITVEEAATVFGDTLSSTITDPLHSHGEHRFVLVGQSAQGRVLVVVHVERGDRIRIISARLANNKERRTYEER